MYAPNNNWKPELGAEGTALAQSVLDELVALGLTNRGVKYNTAVEDTYPDGSYRDIFGIQYWAKVHGMPGILIEHGFIDTSDYWNFLNTDEKLRKLG